MSKPSLGEFVFPVLTASYAIYMISQEISAGLRQTSILYTMAVGVPVLVLCPIVLWNARRSRAGAITEDKSQEVSNPKTSILPPPKVLGLLAITTLTLLSFDVLGYLVSFIGFLTATMILLGLRSAFVIASVSISTVAIVYLLFVWTLGMNFPKGIVGLSF